MDKEFEFFLLALIKHKFNKIVIEDGEEGWVWIRFFNNQGRRFDFKFPKKQIEEFK